MDEFPVATSPAPGVMGVDWESRSTSSGCGSTGSTGSS